MRLTSDYRRVTALFDYIPQQKEVSYPNRSGDKSVGFGVGPFHFKVRFRSLPESHVVIDFIITDISMTDKELVKLFSELEGRQVSSEEAEILKNEVIFNADEAIGIVGPYATRVFGGVLNIIVDYIKEYHPQCIEFSADNEKRVSLYNRLVRRFLPTAKIKTFEERGGGVRFTVCF